MKQIIFKILFPLCYKICCLGGIEKNKVLFIEVRLKGISNNYRLLVEEIEKTGKYRLEFFHLNQGKTGQIPYLKACFQMLFTLATAQYVFLNEGSNVISSVKLRPGTKLVQTWHGCGAFKKFGYSLGENGPKEPYYRNYDFVTVSSPEVIWAYQEAMQIEINKIKPIGVSRTDVFFDEQFHKNAGKKIQKILSEKNIIGKKLILYAPTFRENAGNAKQSDDIDFDYLQENLEEDYVFLMNLHPAIQEQPHILKKQETFVVNMTGKMDIDELLCVADLCITDYSSLIFEYSLLERPMIFYGYDLEKYTKERGYYYEYKEFVPGPIVKNEYELVSAIQHIDQYDQNKIIKFKDKFMNSCDGHATERILGELFCKEGE